MENAKDVKATMTEDVKVVKATSAGGTKGVGAAIMKIKRLVREYYWGTLIGASGAFVLQLVLEISAGRHRAVHIGFTLLAFGGVLSSLIVPLAKKERIHPVKMAVNTFFVGAYSVAYVIMIALWK